MSLKIRRFSLTGGKSKKEAEKPKAEQNKEHFNPLYRYNMLIQPKKQKSSRASTLTKHDSLGSLDNALVRRKPNSITAERPTRLKKSTSMDSFLTQWENKQLSKKRFSGTPMPGTLRGEVSSLKGTPLGRQRSISTDNILETALKSSPSSQNLLDIAHLEDMEQLSRSAPLSEAQEEPLDFFVQFAEPGSHLSPFKGDMSLQDDYSEEEGIIYKDARGAVTKKVAAGMLDKLISQLADGKLADVDYIRVFLMTHNYFMESGLLMLKLIQRYYIEPPKDCGQEQLVQFNRSKEVIRVRTINVIKKWLEVQFSDFEDARLNQLFEGFLQKLTSAGGTEAVWAENLKNFKSGLIEERSKPFCHATPPPKPLLPTNLIPRLIRFLDLHPVEIARQLTRIDFAHFERIEPKEYFHKAWMKGIKAKSPNVLAIVENFNKMTYWVASEIVLAKEDKRLLTITRFLELLEHLREIQNYHGVMMLYSALNLGSVQLFEHTWKEVSSKHMATLKQVEALMDPSGNYKRYRETIKTSPAPLLPFQGVFLTDFTFVDEIPDKLENGMVNFEKMHIIANIFNQLVRFQKHPYNFEEVPYFSEFWKKAVVLSEAELYTTAKKVSAKAAAEKKEGSHSDDDKMSKKSKQKSIHSLIQLSKMRKQTI